MLCSYCLSFSFSLPLTLSLFFLFSVSKSLKFPSDSISMSQCWVLLEIAILLLHFCLVFRKYALCDISRIWAQHRAHDNQVTGTPLPLSFLSLLHPFALFYHENGPLENLWLPPIPTSVLLEGWVQAVSIKTKVPSVGGVRWIGLQSSLPPSEFLRARSQALPASGILASEKALHPFLYVLSLCSFLDLWVACTWCWELSLCKRFSTAPLLVPSIQRVIEQSDEIDTSHLSGPSASVGGMHSFVPGHWEGLQL